MKQKSHRINVSFTEEEFQTLSRWSEKRQESLSSLIRWMANDCMDEAEEQRLSKIVRERKNEPFVSSEEMWASLCIE